MGCLTATEMDSLIRGEIAPESATRLRQHLGECPTCQERLSARQSDEDLLDEVKRLPSSWLEGDLRGAAGSSTDAGCTSAGQRQATPGELLPQGFAGYQVIQRIHQGGQGLVYRALQVGTGREVAIKVLREGPFANPEDRARFEREIRLLASIRHPHIVTVHDSGTVGGNGYFVMDYVAGERLDVYAARIGRPIRRLVELFVKICEAVNAAHLQGIIHRDLKPGNILIDRDCLPRILDFGLAKEATAEVPDPLDAQSMTATGQFLGSLPWASPEQAEGHPLHVDIRTDVYSLGVMFYHALTAHFPYEVTGNMRAILDRIGRADPIRPRTRRAEIDDELETILLKCLSKDRNRRYQTAGELAQDLHRYLAGEPIQAKHDSPLYVVRKMLRRHRMPVAVAAAFAFLVMASAVALAFLYRSARSSAALAEQQRLAAVEAQDLASRNEQAAIAEKQKAEHVWYCTLVAQAARDIEESAYHRARQFLEACSPVCRNWEWGWLQRLTHLDLMTVVAHDGIVRCVDFSPDGSLFATAGTDAIVKIWDSESGALICTLTGHTITVHTAVFSPDGRLLATCGDDHYVGVWRVETGERLRWFEASPSDAIIAVAFDPQGTRLATGSGSYWGYHPRDYSVKIWNLSDGRQLAEFRDFGGAIYSVAFSPDGRWLAAGSEDGRIRVFDLATGDRSFLGEVSPSAVWSVDFSPSGQWLAAAYGRGHTHGNEPDNRAQVWNWRNGELVCALEHGKRTRDSSVYSARFAPDERRLVTVGVDRMARVWEVPSGRQIARYAGHGDHVMSAEFSPSSDRVITGSVDHTVKLWSGPATDPLITLSHKEGVESVAFSPDGRRLAAATTSGMLVLWDTTEAQTIAQRSAHDKGILNVRFSPDGARLATASQDKTVRVFDALTLKEELVIPTQVCDYTACVEFSPDGRRLVVGSDATAIRILDAYTGESLLSLGTEPKCTWGLDHAHAASRLAVANGDAVRVWDTDAGTLLHEMPSPSTVQSWRVVVFSPDDQLLASAGEGGSCILWDTQTAQQLVSLESQSRAVRSLAFSPDGSRLIIGGDDRIVRVYETRSGIELLALREPLAGVRCVAFSPHGRTIATADTDGQVLLWQALPW